MLMYCLECQKWLGNYHEKTECNDAHPDQILSEIQIKFVNFNKISKIYYGHVQAITEIVAVNTKTWHCKLVDSCGDLKLVKDWPVFVDLPAEGKGGAVWTIGKNDWVIRKDIEEKGCLDFKYEEDSCEA